MSLVEKRPTPDPDMKYSVKATCIELGVCHTTLMAYVKRGSIAPIIENAVWPRYSADAIVRCWDIEINRQKNRNTTANQISETND